MCALRDHLLTEKRWYLSESEIKGCLKRYLFDKRYDSIFRIDNFSFISSNIPAELAYGVYIGQPTRYSSNCTQGSDFQDRNKATLIIGWRHCHTISMDVIRNWLTSTIYPFLKCKRKYFFSYISFSLSPAILSLDIEKPGVCFLITRKC